MKAYVAAGTYAQKSSLSIECVLYRMCSLATQALLECAQKSCLSAFEGLGFSVALEA